MSRAFLVMLVLAAVPATWVVAVDRSPLTIELRKNVKVDEARAAKIYDAVCARVSRELNPSAPPRLNPHIVLVVGEKHGKGFRITRNDDGPSVIYMPEWHDTTFAYAVAQAAMQQALSGAELTRISASAIRAMNHVVDVSELKKNP